MGRRKETTSSGRRTGPITGLLSTIPQQDSVQKVSTGKDYSIGRRLIKPDREAPLSLYLYPDRLLVLYSVRSTPG